jgi:MFS superfamily sulfate permease-like transporter
MNSKLLLNDARSGLVVFLVALPLCLGIALAQGVPLFSGIITGIVGGIIVGAISGSHLSVSGPAAGLTSIVLSSVASLGSFEAFLLSLSLAGLIQIVFGAIKAGTVGYYFPSSVIKGMLSAIGIILIIKQVPHFIGYDKDYEGDESFFQVDGQNSFTEFINMFNSISPGSITIGIVSVMILLFWQNKKIKENKILKYIPAALIVVIVGVLMDLVFHYFIPEFEVKDEHLVILPKFDGVQDLFASLTHPDLSQFGNQKIYEVAGLIALVASIETLLNIEAVDKLDHEGKITNTNRELIAQGVGNFISGLIGGLPITSVIVRSSANVDAGARTKISTLVHGFLLLVAVLILPHVLELIPLSALAAILVLTGYKLVKPSLYKNMFKQGWDQFIPFILTVVVMLFTDLLKGVCIGAVASVFYILNQNYRSPFKVIKDNINGRPNYFIKLSQNITFFNKVKFINLFNSIPPDSVLFIDGGRASFIDKDVLELISSFKHSAHLNNIEVHLEEIEEVQIINN